MFWLAIFWCSEKVVLDCFFNLKLKLVATVIAINRESSRSIANRPEKRRLNTEKMRERKRPIDLAIYAWRALAASSLAQPRISSQLRSS